MEEFILSYSIISLLYIGQKQKETNRSETSARNHDALVWKMAMLGLLACCPWKAEKRPAGGRQCDRVVTLTNFPKRLVSPSARPFSAQVCQLHSNCTAIEWEKMGGWMDAIPCWDNRIIQRVQGVQTSPI